MDRTPAQMQDDASMWSRAGYPRVAVGRYRDAAEQLRRVTAELDEVRRISRARIVELEAILKDDYPEGHPALDHYPYPWCRQKESCAGKGSCPLDPNCGD